MKKLPPQPHPNARWAEHLGRWIWPGGMTQALSKNNHVPKQRRATRESCKEITDAANEVLKREWKSERVK